MSRVALLVVSLSVAPSPGQGVAPAGGERYFVTLFGGQSVPWRPNTSHTWATYARVAPRADGSAAVEAFTISWLPADGRPVRPYWLKAEEGHNCTLAETLDRMARAGAVVSAFGPYEIDPARYAAAVAHRDRLESGAVRYRSLGSFVRNPGVENCAQAVGRADPLTRLPNQPIKQPGEPGTAKLAADFARAGAWHGEPAANAWLLPAVGADAHPVTRRAAGERVPRRLFR